MNKTNRKITLRYLPKRLTRRDKKLQYGMLVKSRKLYKKGKYFTRKHVASYKSKPSSHITDAKRLYGVENIVANNELAKKTGCSKAALREIVRKGEGAYYSSGSRPNQTSQSWGVARLASAITSGKAAAVDFSILEKGCNKTSKALRLAKLAKKKHGHGTRRVPKSRA
jgi:DNA-binding Xre family transcriptional regulator